MIDIRHKLNEYLFNFVDILAIALEKVKEERLCKRNVRTSLRKCREMGLDKVLITCDKEI